VEFEYIVDGLLRTISLEKKGDSYIVTDGDSSQEADIQVISSNVFSIKIGARTLRAYMAKEKGKRYIQLDGFQFLVAEPSQQRDGFQGRQEQSQEDMLLINGPDGPGKGHQVFLSQRRTKSARTRRWPLWRP